MSLPPSSTAFCIWGQERVSGRHAQGHGVGGGTHRLFQPLDVVLRRVLANALQFLQDGLSVVAYGRARLLRFFGHQLDQGVAVLGSHSSSHVRSG
jgi:hypothetical protein